MWNQYAESWQGKTDLGNNVHDDKPLLGGCIHSGQKDGTNEHN